MVASQRMKRGLCVLALLVLPALAGSAAELLPISWPTRHASPPPALSEDLEKLLPAFRKGISTLPEAVVVMLALSQPEVLGLTQAEADALRPLAAERYHRLSSSAVYANAESALPYCFDEVQPKEGFARLYVPDGANAATPVILFLHGYGGSFLWYQHWLSETFPDHIILCPAYGVTTVAIAPEYLDEAMAAASRRLGFPLGRPCLMGLSAGGFGACRAFVRDPKKYMQLVCVAAFPPDNVLGRFPASPVARFLAGGNESHVVEGDFQKRVEQVRRTAPKTESRTIPGADHFFMLTHSRETSEILRRWLAP